jgi:hypothetical protein
MYVVVGSPPGYLFNTVIGPCNTSVGNFDLLFPDHVSGGHPGGYIALRSPNRSAPVG